MLRTVELEHLGIIAPWDSLSESRQVWREVRSRYGLGSDNGSSLLTLPSVQPKVGKNIRPTVSITLQAGSDGGLCVNDGPCRATCVVAESYRAQQDSVRLARAARTDFLTEYPGAFLALLLDRMEWAHDRLGILDIRPNANSDVAWERIAPSLFKLIATWNGKAYDYTKRRDRVGYLMGNYRTTYSLTGGTRTATVASILGRGDTCTAVFPAWHGVPTSWRGFPVVDGDTTDDRWSDPAGVVVGLKAKGKLRPYRAHPMLVSV